MITFNIEEPNFKLANRTKLRSWLANVVQSEGKRVGEISFIFCSDDYLLEINRQYLKHDYYTDVITFDYCEGNLLSGDIFISVDTVAENAKTYGETFLCELYRVMVHGVLHLAGYMDATDAEQEQMRQKEDFYLSKAAL